MQRIKSLLSNINLMNLLLAGVLVFIAQYMALPLFNARVKFSLPKVKAAAVQGQSTAEKSDEKSPSPSDYMVIAEQNLFHPDRVIPVPKVEAPPLPKPEFVLYGTLITDNMQIAYMNDKKANGPKKGPQVNQKQIALRPGDTLSGFTLKELTKEQALMQRGEEKITVSLNMPKGRDLAGAAAPGPVAAVPGRPGAPPPAQIGTPPAPPAAAAAPTDPQSRIRQMFRRRPMRPNSE